MLKLGLHRSTAVFYQAARGTVLLLLGRYNTHPHRLQPGKHTRTMAATASSPDSSTPVPHCKVELHVHLDGAIRPETAFELAIKRKLKLPAENVQKLKDIVHERSQGNLVKFLETFSFFLPSVAGDEEAIERMAYEFCEDCKIQGIVYAEARYSPQFLSSTVTHDFCPPGNVTPRRVVECVNRGFKRGGQDFGVKVTSILCCIRTFPDWSAEILSLAKEFMSEGVVGIDLAGDERFANPTHEAHISAFKEAKKIGLCRTVHAGENGSAANVAEAIDQMHAQRIGHGYHALDDATLYARCLKENIHFEECPYSSYATGSVSGQPKDHPLLRFVRDGASFSINTDDPMVTGHTLTDEYELVRDSMGLTWDQMVQANICAAKACFLPDKDKKNLLNRLEESYRRQREKGEKVVFGLE